MSLPKSRNRSLHRLPLLESDQFWPVTQIDVRKIAISVPVRISRSLSPLIATFWSPLGSPDRCLLPLIAWCASPRLPSAGRCLPSPAATETAIPTGESLLVCPNLANRIEIGCLLRPRRFWAVRDASLPRRCPPLWFVPTSCSKVLCSAFYVLDML